MSEKRAAHTGRGGRPGFHWSPQREAALRLALEDLAREETGETSARQIADRFAWPLPAVQAKLAQMGRSGADVRPGQRATHEKPSASASQSSLEDG